MTKTYDAVIRVSRRNNREHLMSPIEQIETIERYCRERGIEIAQTFDETDSVSGKTIEREGLQAALDRALKGATDGIIVAKVDRFARSVVGGLTAVGKLDAAGRDFVAVKDGVGDASNATGRLMRGILFLFAQWQLESLTEGWDATRARHIGNGVHTAEPYGFRKGADRKLVVVADEAEVVVRMYTERAEGASWPSIASGLNTAGVRVRERISAEGKRLNAQGWTAGRVKSIVESRVYLGEIASGEHRNGNAHPAIVSRELWERANNRRSSSGRRESGDFLLTGLARCAACGVKMSGQTTTKAGREYRSYRCRRNHPFGKCPAPASVNAAEIEAKVEAEFGERFFDITADGAVDTTAYDAAHAERVEIEANADAILTSPATARMATVRGADWLIALTDDWTAKIEAAREAEHEAAAEAIGVSFPSTLRTDWPSMTVVERRAFVADGFDLVAVERRVGREPNRIRIFGRGQAPADLMSGKLDRLRPIDLGA